MSEMLHGAENTSAEEERPMLTRDEIQDEMNRFYAERGISPEQHEMVRGKATDEQQKLAGVFGKIPGKKFLALGILALTGLGVFGEPKRAGAEEAQNIQQPKSKAERLGRSIGLSAFAEWLSKDLYKTLESTNFGTDEFTRKRSMEIHLQNYINQFAQVSSEGKQLTPETLSDALKKITENITEIDLKKYPKRSDQPKLLQDNMKTLIGVMRNLRSAAGK